MRLHLSQSCSLLCGAILVSLCSVSQAQVALKKKALTLTDRTGWREILKWPDECERGFREYQKDFPELAGLEFLNLGKGRYLVQILCSAGKVVFMYYDEHNHSPAKLLKFREVENQSGVTNSLPYSEISYKVISFDKKTRVLWIYLKSPTNSCWF